LPTVAPTFAASALRRSSLALALLRFLLFLLPGVFLYREDEFGPRASEPFPAKLFDEERQRELRTLLAAIIEAAEPSRVHPQLTRHLHLGMRKVMPLPGVDPCPQAVCDPLLLHVRSPCPLPRPAMQDEPRMRLRSFGVEPGPAVPGSRTQQADLESHWDPW